MKLVHINSSEKLEQYWPILAKNYFANFENTVNLYQDWQKIIAQQNLFLCLDNNQNLLNLAVASIVYDNLAKPYWLFNHLLDADLTTNNFFLNEILKIIPQNFKVMFCISTKNKNMQQALATNNFWLNHFCFNHE